MTLLRLTRPRVPAFWFRRLTEVRIPGGGRVMGGTLLLAWILLCALLALVPRWWLAARIDRDQRAWFAQARNKAVRLVQEWEHWTIQVPDFARGDEPAVQAWLGREALVEAVVDLSQGRLWLRDGERLRPCTGPATERPAMLVRKAIETTSLGRLDPRSREVPRVLDLDRAKTSFSGIWWPIPTSIIDRDEAPMIVTFERHFALVKHWTAGSPQVERWLKGTLLPTDDFRFGFFTRRDTAQGPLAIFSPPAARSSGPEARDFVDAPYGIDQALSHSFSETGKLVIQMTPEVHQRLWLTHRLRTRLAWSAYGLGVGLSGLALALYILSRHRDRVQAERTAALAHSLKTPLAVLQSRCDTVLNPELPEATRQAHLLNIGQEVRHLTRLIEAGLEGTRPEAQDLDRIDNGFLETLEEELGPAFETQGRALEVYSAQLSFQGRASRVRMALVTLLENALLHGRGCVELRASQEPGRVLFTVADEGEGLPGPVAERLAGGRPGPAGQGQGLGLRMLVQVARAEGWGLTLENLEPGLRARLEIRT